MKNLKLTIAEAQEILLMSQSSVYSWIDKGKLQAVETPSGKIIQITEFEANQIREMNLKSKRNKASKQLNKDKQETILNNEQEEEIPIISKNYTQTNMTESLTEKLILELKELAVEAGKYKQLEIIRTEEKENQQYWQEKYFEMNAECKQKNDEILALKSKILELEQKLEKVTKKGFFGKMFTK